MAMKRVLQKKSTKFWPKREKNNQSTFTMSHLHVRFLKCDSAMRFCT
jgi:hypothetical protein